MASTAGSPRLSPQLTALLALILTLLLLLLLPCPLPPGMCVVAPARLPACPPAGIMLIQAYGGFKRMVSFCKSRVPAYINDMVEAVKVSR